MLSGFILSVVKIFRGLLIQSMNLSGVGCDVDGYIPTLPAPKLWVSQDNGGNSAPSPWPPPRPTAIVFSGYRVEEEGDWRERD